MISVTERRKCNITIRNHNTLAVKTKIIIKQNNNIYFLLSHCKQTKPLTAYKHIPYQHIAEYYRPTYRSSPPYTVYN